jgi:alpha-L-rhamnosidase
MLVRLLPISVLVTLALSAGSLVAGSDAADTANATGAEAPTGLQVEYAVEPMGVSVAAPRFTWQSPWTDGAHQVAARVQVARTPDFDERIWDSGMRTTGDLRIVYSGLPLAGGERYYWRVASWDAQGTRSPWSSPSWWSQGPGTAAEWRGASWISATAPPAPPQRFDPADDPRRAPAFRHPFTVPAGTPIAWATATVAGLGLADVWLDGEPIGPNVLDPATADFSMTVPYVEHDITARLRDAQRHGTTAHALGIVLGSGFYAPEAPDVKRTQDAPWIDVRKALVLLTVRFADGTTAYEVSGTAGWTQSETASNTSFDSPYAGETMVPDAGDEVREAWSDASFDDRSWSPVLAATAPAGALRGQPQPAMRRVSEVALVRSSPAPGVWLYTAPANVTGWARVTLGETTEPGHEVTVKYDETLIDQEFIDAFPTFPDFIRTQPQYAGAAPDPSRIGQVSGELNSHPIDAARRWQTDIVTTIDGRQTFEPRFSYKGFRYIQIEGLATPPESVTAFQVHSDVPVVGSFSSDDDFLNRLHAADMLTYLGNLQGVPTDCPTREKRSWGADAAAAQVNGMLNFDTVAVYEKFLRDLRESQDANGSMPNWAPTPGPGKYDFSNFERRFANPWWGGAGAMLAWELYRFTGDTRPLAENYEMVTRYITNLRTVKNYANYDKVFTPIDPSTGLSNPVARSYGDHPAPVQTDPAVMATVGYYLQVTLAAKMAAILEKTADAAMYESYARTSRASMNAIWFDAANHRYSLTTTPRSGSKVGTRKPATTTATWLGMAQALGITPEGEGDAVDRQLVDTLAAFGGGVPTGMWGTKYVLQALSIYDHDDIAYAMIAEDDPTRPSYRSMVDQPGGTIWEMFPSLHALGSENHPAYTVVEEWLYERVAGIGIDRLDPEAPLLIAPHPVGDVTRASASTRVVGGEVAVSWSLGADGALSLDVTIPQGRTAELSLPGERVTRVDGTMAARRLENGRSVYALPAGTHRIVSILSSVAASATHDLTGDGRNDLVTRTSSGVVMVYPGTGTGTLGAGRRITSGWRAMTAVIVGTFDSDAHADLVARDTAGTLWLYRGDGAGRISGPRVRIGSGWKSYGSLFSPGDVDGDGDGDLVARDARGYLWLYRGIGDGRIGDRVRLGTSTAWKKLAVFGEGDLDGDGAVDLLARGSAGRVWVFPGDGGAGLGPAKLIGDGWGSMTGLVSIGDLTGDRLPDLIARDKKGRLWLYPAVDGPGYGKAVLIGSGFATHRIAS